LINYVNDGFEKVPEALNTIKARGPSTMSYI